MCWHAWASAAAAADKLVTWFTGWEWPWKAVGHGSHMAEFGTDVVGELRGQKRGCDEGVAQPAQLLLSDFVVPQIRSLLS